MRILGIVALGATLGGCAAINVHETTLSTNQKVAIVSSPGDGVSPPSSTILVAGRSGQFVPVSTGYAQAPVTAAISGATAGIAIGAGNYAGRILIPAFKALYDSMPSDQKKNADQVFQKYGPQGSAG